MGEWYEAVVGYTLDGECATWGAGESAHAALMDACQRFMADQRDYITPDRYEATIYDTPMEKRWPGGDSEVYAWLDRGTSVMTVGPDGRYTVDGIIWDGVGVSDG